MPNRIQKLLYFLSAEAPILIMLAIVWAIQNTDWKVPVLLISIAVVVILMFNFSFNYAKKNLPGIPVRVTDLANGDEWIVAYVISYLLPFASLVLNQYVAWIACFIVLILMVALTITDYVSPHPWLYLKGYHFYKISVEGANSGYYLISKQTLRKPKDVTYVSRVFEFLLIRNN